MHTVHRFVSQLLTHRHTRACALTHPSAYPTGKHNGMSAFIRTKAPDVVSPLSALCSLISLSTKTRRESLCWVGRTKAVSTQLYPLVLNRLQANTSGHTVPLQPEPDNCTLLQCYSIILDLCFIIKKIVSWTFGWYIMGLLVCRQDIPKNFSMYFNEI